MRFTKKLTSIFLSLSMVASVVSVGAVTAAAESETVVTYAQKTIQGSAVLHCFDWSYNSIKANLPDIAAAGYTAVQTSPVQAPKDYNSSWTDGGGQWWKLYQPLGMSIADGNTWLGTKEELTELCAEADRYGIKVIVDIVANHLANNGTDGGTYEYLNSGVDEYFKNSDYFHNHNEYTNGDSRYNITQYHLGMPDLNTYHDDVQQKVLELLEECVDCGVDGFRFDAAKHIELPDDENCGSNFWPTVINGIKTYAGDVFCYGEILNSAGPDTDIGKYTQYMAVTDNYTGDRALDKTVYTAASELASSTYYKGASADKSVLWVESHDTYMGDSGSAGIKNTKDVSAADLTKAWAIVASRAKSTSLYFARPNATMGAASTDTTWKSTAVTEVNKFKNHFNGTDEYLSSGGSTAYIERGTKGVVISKLDGAGDVSLDAHRIADGEYTDQVSGNIFTVADGKITGTVGSSGVAVVYDPNVSALDYFSAEKLYLYPQRSSWRNGDERYAMYVYSAAGGSAWASMTDSDSDGIYEADVPEGNWTNVIFCRMVGSTTENNWDNKWNQTVDLAPTDDNNQFTVVAKEDGNKYTGTWSVFGAGPVLPEETKTVYAINDVKWNNLNFYWWGSKTACKWPGYAMDSYSGSTVYTCTIPDDATGLVFNNGNADNSNQTVNIESGIEDGAVWTINFDTYDGKHTVSTAPEYYLAGTMNNWSCNDDYAFSLCESEDGKVEYKLSGVQLSENAECKVRSTDTWYPQGGENSNFVVTATGTYDVYFRPNADGDDDWHQNYFKCVNVTPYTITWRDDNGDTLNTSTALYGTTPAYPDGTPSKQPTEQECYTFAGWTPNVVPATDDAEYTATYTFKNHTWNVGWEWVQYNSANATFTCDDCGYTITSEADISYSCEVDGVIYKATVNLDDHEYTDEKKKAYEPFIAHSLTLEGDIGVNFYLNIPDAYFEIGTLKNVTVKFAWSDKTETVTLGYENHVVQNCYKVTCDVAPAEMTYPITATAYADGKPLGDPEQYSVKTYADKVLKDPAFIKKYIKQEFDGGRDGNGRYEQLNSLVRYMLDYGTRAQLRFDRNTNALANGNDWYKETDVKLNETIDDMTADLSDYGLTYVGSTVIYLSKMTLRHYYTVSESETFSQYADSVTMDGAAAQYGERDGMIFFEKTNIAAADLDTHYQLKIGSNEYNYSVLNYVQKLLSSSQNEAAKELGKATVRYNEAANSYFP